MPKGIKHKDVGVECSYDEFHSIEAHELASGTSFPVSPVEQELFYRTDLHTWYIYNGSSWNPLSDCWKYDSSGEWTFTATETTLITKTGEMAVFLKFNLAGMVANDVIRIKVKSKTKSGGTYQIEEDKSFYNVQTYPVQPLGPYLSEWDITVTIQRTGGSDDSKKVEWICFRDR